MRCSNAGRPVMFLGLMSLTSPILWHLSIVCQIAVEGIQVTVTEPNLRRTMQKPVMNHDVSNMLEKTISNPVWLITGSSIGLGHPLASAGLRLGHRVLLVARYTAALAAFADPF